MLCVSLFTRSLHAFHWFPKASFVFRSLSTPTQYLLYRTYTQFKALRLMPTTHPPSNKKNAHHFVHRSLNIIEWTLMLGMRPGHSASMLRNRGSDSILRSVDHLFTRDETSLVRSPPFHSAHLHSPPLPKDQEGGGRRVVDVWEVACSLGSRALIKNALVRGHKIRQLKPPSLIMCLHII